MAKRKKAKENPPAMAQVLQQRHSMATHVPPEWFDESTHATRRAIRTQDLACGTAMLVASWGCACTA